MRLCVLYVYPEEWTGTRAREIQTLQTCLALADAGVEVELVVAGGSVDGHARALGRDTLPRGLGVTVLSRRLGPLRSARLFARRLRRWLPVPSRFTCGYVIHLKAASMLAELGIPYWYEAHEVFAETAGPGSRAGARLAQREREALARAAGRIATSGALAGALNARYCPESPLGFVIVPNAGDLPLRRGIGDPRGPLVYAGSLGDWKGVPFALEAAAQAGFPVRIVGGTEAEWERLAASLSTSARGVTTWRARVALRDFPTLLAGSRAGLIPTLPTIGSGRYSCPMKLFDYARCGLPVIVTDLPSLASLDLGPWCVRVRGGSVAAWKEALTRAPADGEAALAWAAAHTWQARAAALIRAFTPV